MKKIKMEKPNETGEQVSLQSIGSSSSSSSSPSTSPPATALPVQPMAPLNTAEQLDESRDSLFDSSLKKAAAAAVDHSLQEQPDVYGTDSNLLIESSAALQQQTPQQAKQQSQQPQQNSPQQQQQQTQQAFTGRALPPGAPANYCNICNKELCNKYFMKTHMQKMHGINLDDLPREAANSGGVVCDICQKELCSKYFLKVHKSNTHGITEFTSGSAGSQAANAATAVAAIALTNYSLNNAQKRAAINLALNQHQLQNRQAAALMNAAASAGSPATNFNSHLQIAQAAKAAALHQRDQQLYASSLINQLKQQQTTKQQAHHQHQSAPLPVAQNQLDLRLHQQHQQASKQSAHQHQSQPHTTQSQAQVHQRIPEADLSLASSLTSNFPASLLAATVTNPLLVAQLAQQQFPALHGQVTVPTGSNQQRPQQQAHSFFGAHDTSLFDTEDDTSDRDSLTDKSSDLQQQHQQSSFHQQMQNQQALLNAAAVFNPAAAAAAMMAMHQHQQQTNLQHHQQQQQLQHQQQQQRQNSAAAAAAAAAAALVQPVAIDLRNQQSAMSQLLAQKMLEAAAQHPDDQLLVTKNNCNNNADLVAASAQHSPLNLLDKCTTRGPQSRRHRTNQFNLVQDDDNELEEEEAEVAEEEELADSDRESSSYLGGDESLQLTVPPKGLAQLRSAPMSLGGFDTSALNNNIVERSSLCSSANNSIEMPLEQPVNCAKEAKKSAPKSNSNGNSNKRHKQQHHHHPKSTIGKNQPQLDHLGSSTLRLASNLAAQLSNNLPNLSHHQQQHTTTDHHPPSVNYSPTGASSVHHQNARTGAAPSSNTSSSISVSNTNNGSTPQQPPNNNNNSSSSNSNSRYLRHYTEACPICDRRFKSIKWLQSHVMNDHKNEIGNLFNLLFQVLLCGGGGASGGGGNGAVGSGAEGNNGLPSIDATTGGSTHPLNSLANGLMGADGGIVAAGGARGDGGLDHSQYLAGMLNVAELAQQHQLQLQHPLSKATVGTPLTTAGSAAPQNKPTSAGPAVINNRADA